MRRQGEGKRRGRQRRKTGGGGEKEERRTDKTSDEENWARVVELVQTAFQDWDLAEESTWQVVVLIRKGKGDYRGICLVEVMWKVVAVILNRRFTSSITFHDVLHGSQVGCGTGTATLEAKLLQHLASMREEVLYVIFLDLTKA